MDDFEKNNELSENEAGNESANEPAVTEEPSFEEPVTENAEPQVENTQPVPPVQPPYTPPIPPQAGYPYGQGAQPNTAYPYSPIQNGYNNAPYQQPPYFQNPNGYQPPVSNRPAPPKPKKSNAGRAVLIILIVAILGIAGVLAVHTARKNIGKKAENTTSGDKKTEAVSDSVTLTINDNTPSDETKKTSSTGALSATEIYDKVNEVSVGVLVYQSAGTASFASNLYGEGSGVLTQENSDHTGTYVITCAHVVSGTGLTVKVQLSDGEQYSADIVGIDNKTDIAVLLVKKTGLKSAEFGSTKDLKVGQTVYAIGNPGGTEFFGSFTSGIVSAIARPINSPVGYEMNCIQHDAAINPGNSGGALVNEYGQVIGINSSKIAAEEYEGMGFAVPSETVKEIADEIIAHGYVTDRAKLGITYATVSQYQAYSMVVQIKNYPAGSIIINSISSDSSLANSKAQSGDLIIKVNGEDLTTADVLLDLIQNGHVGDKLTLTLVRINSNYETTEFDVEATLVEDRGTTEEVTEESSEYFNPFDFNN